MPNNIPTRFATKKTSPPTKWCVSHGWCDHSSGIGGACLFNAIKKRKPFLRKMIIKQIIKLAHPSGKATFGKKPAKSKASEGF